MKVLYYSLIMILLSGCMLLLYSSNLREIEDYSSFNYIANNFDYEDIQESSLILIPTIAKPGLEFITGEMDSLISENLLSNFPTSFKKDVTNYIQESDSLKILFDKIAYNILTQSKVNKKDIIDISTITHMKYLFSIYVYEYGILDTDDFFIHSQSFGNLPVTIEKEGFLVIVKIFNGQEGVIIWEKNCVFISKKTKNDVRFYMNVFLSNLLNSLASLHLDRKNQITISNIFSKSSAIYKEDVKNLINDLGGNTEYNRLMELKITLNKSKMYILSETEFLNYKDISKMRNLLKENGYYNF